MLERSGAISLLLLVSCSVAPLSTQAAEEDDPLERMAASAGQQAPVLRIGLAAAHVIEVASPQPFRIIDPSNKVGVWKPRFEGTIRVVAEGGPREELGTVYRVQVGAYGSREAAERKKREFDPALNALRHLIAEGDIEQGSAVCQRLENMEDLIVT